MAGIVPLAVKNIYVKTIVICYIGNAYGVSWAAKDYYDDLISRFQETEIQQVALLLLNKEISSRLQILDCAKRFLTICEELRKRATNVHTINALDNILKVPPQELSGVASSKERRALLSALSSL